MKNLFSSIKEHSKGLCAWIAGLFKDESGSDGVFRLDSN